MIAFKNELVTVTKSADEMTFKIAWDAYFRKTAKLWGKPVRASDSWHLAWYVTDVPGLPPEALGGEGHRMGMGFRARLTRHSVS